MQGQFTRSWNGSEQAPPGSVRPRFYLDPVQDELASAREGRPIFKEVERVEIFMPGNPYAIPVFNVTDQHRERWPRVYEQFRESIEQTAEVVPSHEELLAEWRLTHPKPTAAQVAEVIAKRDAGEKAEAEAKPATPPAPATAPVPAAVVSAQP
jgi:hypothetical protein